MGKSLLKLLLVLMLVGVVQTVNAQDPYAVLSENNTVLTFYYDGNKVSQNGYGIGPFELNDTRWGGNSNKITKVVFDSSFKNCTSITSTAYWFLNCYYLTTIEGIDNLKTSNVVDMTAMFANCQNLTSLTLWNFDTSNVTHMNSMFQDCSSLVSLSLEGFKTEKVTDMSCMFRGCKKLPSLLLTDFNTKNVTNMWCMFYDCNALTILDIYYFDTSNVTDMSSMFQDCSSLSSIELRGFNTEKVTNMGQMFHGCSKLAKLDMSKFNTQNVTNFQCLFTNCSELTTLDLTTFNTAQVEHMGQVFEGCSKLKTIYVDKDKWTTSAVTFGPKTFDGCTSLIGGAGTAYNAEQIDYTYARIDGGTDKPGYLTDKSATPSPSGDLEPYAVLSDNNTVLTFYYDDQKESRGGMSVGPFGDASYRGWRDDESSITSVVFDKSFANCISLTSTAFWFYGCEKLTNIIGIEYLKTDGVTTMQGMFTSCSSLTNLDVSNFNTANVTIMYGLFWNCSSLKNLDVSNFNTAKVANMGCLFYGCSGLTYLDVSNFKTDNVTGMEYMFRGCSGLTDLDLSNFNTAKVTNMWGMFLECSGLTSLDLSNFNTTKVTNVNYMFSGCSGLKTIYVGSDWTTSSVRQGTNIFKNCTKLVGSAGTEYDANHTDYTYARIDGGTDNPGYFTDKNAKPSTSVDAEPYAALSEDNTLLTFYYDDKKESRGGYDLGPLEYDFYNDKRWGGHAYDITTVVFDASFAGCTSITSTLNWFMKFVNLRKVIGIKYFNTINVKSMRFMFSGCEKLTVLDVSHFDTRNVTDMSAMFSACENLKKLDVSSFDTRNVTAMGHMFGDCKSLKTLDVSHFDVSKVRDFISMFSECTSLSAIYCDKSWVKNSVMSTNMFYKCSSLSGYDTEMESDIDQIRWAKPIANGGYFTPTSEIVQEGTDEAAVAYLRERGVLNNSDIDEAQEEDPLKRGFLAKIAFRGLYSTFGGEIPKSVPSDNYPTIYSDLTDKSTDYYRGARALLYLEYGDGVSPFDRNRLAFEPEEMIARVHVLKVLLETFNIKPEPDYISKAASWGIIKSSENFRPYDNCTRGEAFLMLARTMQKIEAGEIDDPNPKKSDYFEPLNTTLKTISLGASLQMGNFQHYTKTSFALNGVVPLAFAHTYNSYNTTLPSVFFGDKSKTEEDDSYHPLGDGWSHNYHSFITVVGDYQNNAADNGLRVIVHWGGGSIDIYKYDGTRLVPESMGIYDEMEYSGGDELTIKSKSQISYTFSKQGSSGAAVFYLSSVKDRNGNTLTINYEDGLNGSARIKSVSDGNRSLDFSYLSGTDLLSEVKDPLSRSIKFDYFDNSQTGKKQLKSFTDAEGNTTTYEYADLSNAGTSKLLSRIQLPKGNYIENEYDANRRLKKSESGVNGVPTTKTSVNVTANYGGGSSISTQSQVDVERGSQTSSYQYTYNENNVVTSMTGEKGLFAKGKYSNSSHPELLTAIQGNSTEVNDISYDEKGNVTSISVRGDGTLTTTMTYDDMNNLTSRTDPMGNKTTFSYDGNGNLTSVSAPEGVTVSISVNSKGLPTETSNAMGIKTQYDYNEYGNLIKTTLPALGLSRTAVYDAASRLTSATDALGRTSSFVYNNNDYLTSETDAMDHTTKYSYDANDNLTSITNAKGGVTTMSYDNATDWLLSVEFAGAKKQYDYNKDGTLSSFSKPDGTTLSYSYDELGRITSDGINSYSYDNKLRLSEVSDGSKGISFSYDGFNRIIGTSFDGQVNNYSYDDNSNCTKVNDTEYSYDGLNRLTSVSFSGKTITYSYRKDSQLSEVSYPNGMTTTYSYDEVGRLTSKQTKLSNGTVIAGYSYVFDKVGNITEQTTQEPYAGMVVTNEETSYSYNEGNRITKAGDLSFEFDANGNTTKRGEEAYSWDKQDRLTSAGSTSITYDPLGLIASYGDITFTTDPLGIGNVLSDSKSGAEYIYGNGLEARVVNGKASYYVTDVRGSVVAIVDEDGNITHKYQYDEFGKVTQKEEADYNPFQYVGKYGVMALNDHQYYMRARHYDPTIGRFLSEDPIWSTNLYPYANNNPIMGIDPRGTVNQVLHEAPTDLLVIEYLQLSKNYEELGDQMFYHKFHDDYYKSLENNRLFYQNMLRDIMDEIYSRNDYKQYERNMSYYEHVWYDKPVDRIDNAYAPASIGTSSSTEMRYNKQFRQNPNNYGHREDTEWGKVSGYGDTTSIVNNNPANVLKDTTISCFKNHKECIGL